MACEPHGDGTRHQLETGAHDGPANALVRSLVAPRVGLGLLCLIVTARVSAQDLDPRAYANVPVDATFLISGFALLHGGVVSDPTLPITDIQATVETPSLGIARSFNMFGRTAQGFGVLPYSFAQVSGKALGKAGSVSRNGLADMRLRLSVLLHGAPAVSALEFAKAPRRTILGTSLTVIAPTGQFSPDRLINIGTNRWAFKPELAVSQPIRQRWLVDLYAGVWIFTSNDEYYPGTLVRTQAPLGTLQSHVSYNFRRQLWAAFDATYYAGGRTKTQGVLNSDRQSNSRVGATLVLPVGRRHSIKLAASTGAVIRYGANFNIFSIGWQTGWVPRPKATSSRRHPPSFWPPATSDAGDPTRAQ